MHHASPVRGWLAWRMRYMTGSRRLRFGEVEHPEAKMRFPREGGEFHFQKAVSFILPTQYVSYDLREFVEILKRITIDSIYFHIFEARLRLEKGTNDFSNWIENSIGDKPLAISIARLDPYVYTLEDLRQTITHLIERETG